MIGVVVIGLLVTFLVVKVRRRRRREFSTDTFARLLDLKPAYRGPKWRVGPWL